LADDLAAIVVPVREGFGDAGEGDIDWGEYASLEDKTMNPSLAIVVGTDDLMPGVDPQGGGIMGAWKRSIEGSEHASLEDKTMGPPSVIVNADNMALRVDPSSGGVSDARERNVEGSEFASLENKTMISPAGLICSYDPAQRADSKRTCFGGTREGNVEGSKHPSLQGKTMGPAAIMVGADDLAPIVDPVGESLISAWEGDFEASEGIWGGLRDREGTKKKTQAQKRAKTIPCHGKSPCRASRASNLQGESLLESSIPHTTLADISGHFAPQIAAGIPSDKSVPIFSSLGSLAYRRDLPIRVKNSVRVATEFRKLPSIAEVVIIEFCFSTPRIIMHRC
jgi:hypothetical protein